MAFATTGTAMRSKDTGDMEKKTYDPPTVAVMMVGCATLLGLLALREWNNLSAAQAGPTRGWVLLAGPLGFLSWIALVSTSYKGDNITPLFLSVLSGATI